MNGKFLNEQGVFLVLKTFFERLHGEVFGSETIIELDDGAIMSVNLPDKGNSHIYWYRVGDDFKSSNIISRGSCFLNLKKRPVEVDISCDGETASVPCQYGYFMDLRAGKGWPEKCKERNLAEALVIWICARELRKEVQTYHGLKNFQPRLTLGMMEVVQFQGVAQAYENHLNLFHGYKLADEELDAIATAQAAAKLWIEKAGTSREKAFDEIAQIIKS